MFLVTESAGIGGSMQSLEIGSPVQLTVTCMTSYDAVGLRVKEMIEALDRASVDMSETDTAVYYMVTGYDTTGDEPVKVANLFVLPKNEAADSNSKLATILKACD